MSENKQDVFKQINYPEENCSSFIGLCDKAKALLFDSLVYQDKSIGDEIFNLIHGYNILEHKLTPVEQIFWVAYCVYIARFYEFNIFEYDLEYLTTIPTHAMFMEEICVQKEIYLNNKKYVPDFIIDLSRKNCKNEYVYPELKDLKYIIEIDGFDYHSKKEQMNYDYGRETDLKLAGYNIIRFTGSQVFREPFTCVDKVVAIILNDINKKVDV